VLGRLVLAAAVASLAPPAAIHGVPGEDPRVAYGAGGDSAARAAYFVASSARPQAS